MAKNEFITGLRALGFEPQELSPNRVIFKFEVPVGGNIGVKIMIGFEVQDDYPMSCPPGPHFKSVGIQGWKEPPNNIHASPFGTEWRYWSRPFPDWNRTNRSAKVYLAHIKNLLTRII